MLLTLLTLWRHGEAGSAATDEARALTERGCQEVAEVVEGYRQWMDDTAIAPVSSLLYSPLKRTEETALILQGALEPARSQVCPALMPGAQPADFSESDLEKHSHNIMVSHQPFLSWAIQVWADDDSLPPLAPGGYSVLSVLSLERGGAEVIRHLPDPRAAAPYSAG